MPVQVGVLAVILGRATRRHCSCHWALHLEPALGPRGWAGGLTFFFFFSFSLLNARIVPSALCALAPCILPTT